MNVICKRCLLKEMSEASYQNIAELISLIPADKKAEDSLYKSRLDICKDCDCLTNGMCSKCGCFVELRAAYSHTRCPHENKLW
ncbi:MAG: hypothetical protein IJ045_02540 [Ruminiclostridium sp.]|nr:hypothetical protein [Ruminiclostridium sp.]